MKFELPVASRQRLDELLEYLGDRAEEFKKCFDIESEWCWKYADIVLRGLDERNLEYAERHHIIPVAYYKLNGVQVGRWADTIAKGNYTVLSFAEHLYAHYCLALCSTGELNGKMSVAFCTMWGADVRGGFDIPEESKLLTMITEADVSRIRGMNPQVSKVDADGRTHFYEDPEKAQKESGRAYYEENKELVKQRNKKRREEHRDELIAYGKQWYRDNTEHVKEYQKNYQENNREKISSQRKDYREKNKERIAKKKHDDHIKNREADNARGRKWYAENKEYCQEKSKEYRDTHREEKREHDRKYHQENRDAILVKNKERYQKNKDKISAKQKEYRANNKEAIAVRKKQYAEENKDKISAHRKECYNANPEKYKQKSRDFAAAKKAAGYRYRKDPTTGKQPRPPGNHALPHHSQGTRK